MIFEINIHWHLF